jgi:type IV secretory pathway VirB2 component (pilin)
VFFSKTNPLQVKWQAGFKMQFRKVLQVIFGIKIYKLFVDNFFIDAQLCSRKPK